MNRGILRRLRAGTAGAVALGVLAATPALAAHSGGPITLRGYDGGAIAPATSTEAYSPKQTCSATSENGLTACHGEHTYDAITSAYHFQQGFDVASDTFNPDKPFIKSPGMYGKW